MKEADECSTELEKKALQDASNR